MRRLVQAPLTRAVACAPVSTRLPTQRPLRGSPYGRRRDAAIRGHSQVYTPPFTGTLAHRAFATEHGWSVLTVSPLVNRELWPLGASGVWSDAA